MTTTTVVTTPYELPVGEWKFTERYLRGIELHIPEKESRQYMNEIFNKHCASIRYENNYYNRRKPHAELVKRGFTWDTHEWEDVHMPELIKMGVIKPKGEYGGLKYDLARNQLFKLLIPAYKSINSNNLRNLEEIQEIETKLDAAHQPPTVVSPSQDKSDYWKRKQIRSLVERLKALRRAVYSGHLPIFIEYENKMIVRLTKAKTRNKKTKAEIDAEPHEFVFYLAEGGDKLCFTFEPEKGGRDPLTGRRRHAKVIEGTIAWSNNFFDKERFNTLIRAFTGDDRHSVYLSMSFIRRIFDKETGKSRFLMDVVIQRYIPQYQIRSDYRVPKNKAEKDPWYNDIESQKGTVIIAVDINMKNNIAFVSVVDGNTNRLLEPSFPISDKGPGEKHGLITKIIREKDRQAAISSREHKGKKPYAKGEDRRITYKPRRITADNESWLVDQYKNLRSRAVNKIMQIADKYLSTEYYRVAILKIETFGVFKFRIKEGYGKRNKRSRMIKNMFAYTAFRDELLHEVKKYSRPDGVILTRFCDPRNTSRRCPECGCIDARNRNDRTFLCVDCGYTAHADLVASINLAAYNGKDPETTETLFSSIHLH